MDYTRDEGEYEISWQTCTFFVVNSKLSTIHHKSHKVREESNV